MNRCSLSGLSLVFAACNLLQVLSGIFCIILGRLNSNFQGSVALLVLFALAAQVGDDAVACGVKFSIM